MRELMAQACFIYRFKQSRAEFAMDLDCRSDDTPCERILLYLFLCGLCVLCG